MDERKSEINSSGWKELEKNGRSPTSGTMGELDV